jgi:hypothetical protein
MVGLLTIGFKFLEEGTGSKFLFEQLVKFLEDREG